MNTNDDTQEQKIPSWVDAPGREGIGGPQDNLQPDKPPDGEREQDSVSAAAAKPPNPAKARHQKALLEHFERTRNDQGQPLTGDAVEMKSRLSLVVTLDGVYTAPRYDLVTKDKKLGGKFYPSENAGEQSQAKTRHQALVSRHVAQWQNSMEAAQGREAVAAPRHTTHIRNQGRARPISQQQAPQRESVAFPEKEKDRDR